MTFKSPALRPGLGCERGAALQSAFSPARLGGVGPPRALPLRARFAQDQI
jgi:hypothetical protein